MEHELKELNIGGRCIPISDENKGSPNDYANLEARIFLKTEENREMMEKKYFLCRRWFTCG